MAQAFRPTRESVSSNDFTAWTAPARAKPAGQALAFPLSNTSSRRTAAKSGSKANSARERLFSSPYRKPKEPFDASPNSAFDVRCWAFDVLHPCQSARGSRKRQFHPLFPIFFLIVATSCNKLQHPDEFRNRQSAFGNPKFPMGEGRFFSGTAWDDVGLYGISTTYNLDARFASGCWILDAGGETVSFCPCRKGAKKFLFF